MADLEERLRRYVKTWSDNPTGFGVPGAGLIIEAADEIRVLEAENSAQTQTISDLTRALEENAQMAHMLSDKLKSMEHPLAEDLLPLLKQVREALSRHEEEK